MGTIFQSTIAVAVAVVLLMAAADAAAQEQTREQVKQRTQERAGQREIIPGSELMTSSEREDYRRRYARAKTVAEQEKVRAGISPEREREVLAAWHAQQSGAK